MVALFEGLADEAITERGLRGIGALWSRILRDLLRPLPGPVGAVPSALPGSETGHEREGGWRMGRFGWAGRTGEDIAFALKALRREARFTGLVVAVLAVGIALSVAVFAVLNAYLLRPLPYPAPQRLVNVRGWHSVSWTEVEDVFELAVSWDLDVFTLVGDGKPELARGAWITPDFLDMYSVRAHLGRTFRPDEVGEGGRAVAMISHALWLNRFGGDPNIVGRSFRAFTSDRPTEAELFTVVGVLPEDFWYLNEYTDVLAPIRDERPVYSARLRPGVSVAQAQEALTRIAVSRMDDVPPEFRVEVVSLHERHVVRVRPTLLVLQAAVLLVLLIACANAGVLLLVRSARREREFGVRRALGASGARLARQLVAEGALIATAAGATGVLLAALGLELARGSLEARLGTRVPGGADTLAPDAVVLLAAVGLCGLVGVVFGLVPLLTSGRDRLTTTLAGRGRGGTDPRGRGRARNVMVAVEVALSLALLTGAGLMVRSAANLQRRELGFRPERVVRGVVGLREGTYPTPEDRIALFDRLVTQVRGLPGVEAAGLSVSGPFLATRFDPRPLEAQGPATSTYGEAVDWLVGEGYFDALGISVLRGRGFATEDAHGAEPVAVVSESLARDLWGPEDPLGRGVRLPPSVMPGTTAPDPGPWLRVVGVVADIERDVGGSGAGDVYRTYRQASPLWMSVIARQRPGAASVVPAIEATLRELDPEVPLSSVLRLDVAVRQAMAPTRFLAWLLVGFSGFALLLAVVGLYGVVSYAARQRQRDIAIRVALGADRGSVTGLFLRQGLTVVAAGMMAGTGGGYILGRALEGQLHGVAPGDVPTHLALAVILGVTAVVAVWLPAHRAAGADPMGLLREE